jgi:muramidase (phage lysozyme)
MTPNEKAFLDTIAFSEGTYGKGDDGYNVLVGGSFFDGYDDHPRISVYLPSLNIHSTAAGRYQLLEKYFDAYKSLLRVPDFSPPSQDAIAWQQIKECGAIDDIEAGDFGNAVVKCAHIWASLPGAGYGQHENKLQALSDFFAGVGGTLA